MTTDPSSSVSGRIRGAERIEEDEKETLGRYIIADLAICHGKPTFLGTRILVADVLEQVARGVAWESIVDAWRGDIPKDAIAEAVRLDRAIVYAGIDAHRKVGVELASRPAADSDVARRDHRECTEQFRTVHFHN